MKQASKYIDPADMVPVMHPPAVVTPRVQGHASSRTTSSSRPRPRKFIIAALLETISILYIVIATFLVFDSTSIFIASCQAILVTGFVLAILLSRLAGATAAKLGFTQLEQAPQQASAKTFAWQKVPLYPRINHRLLIRALKQRPALRYWYAMSFSDVSARRFVTKAKLAEKYKTILATLKSIQIENWASANDGCWKVGFEAGVIADSDDAIVIPSTELGAALAGHMPGISFEEAGRTRCLAYMLGDELASDTTIPKELAPDIPAGTAVEVHAPVALTNDVIVGKVVEPESLVAIADAGIRFDHIRGGMIVAGGKVAERVAFMKLLLSTQMPFTIAVIDDRGDFHVPGAKILTVGTDCTLNPLVPGTPQHASLLVAALNAIHGFSDDQEAFLVPRITEVLQGSGGTNKLPSIQTLIELLMADAKSPQERAVAMVMRRDFTDTIGIWTSLADNPSLGDEILAHKKAIIDLSGLPGTEQRVVKAILLLKLQALSKLVDARKPLLIVFPEIDGVFHDNHVQRPSPRVARSTASPINAVMAGAKHLITTCQDPAALPDAMLAYVATIVAFRIVNRQGQDVISATLGLEDEQLYEHSRHASYQRRYLAEMGEGMAYIRRPDIATPFLAAIDIDRATRLMPRSTTNHPAPKASENGTLEGVLAEFGPVGRDVLDVLDAMRRSGNQGVKRDWMQALLAEKCAASITSREPNLPQKDVVARSKAMTARIIDALDQRGILIADGYNPSGLKKGITTRLSQYGAAMLERWEAKSNHNIIVVDSIERLRDQANKAMIELVTLFHELDARGKLDEVKFLVDRCNIDAQQLEFTMQENDEKSIELALAKIIEDQHKVLTISK
ncbi:MAG TPA: hypothetical protein VKM55_12890 [Candidatus Lokiarchaeia archaeon]|nr:hypothetical protein [Candidatus Lokiarchaeia archaeon]